MKDIYLIFFSPRRVVTYVIMRTGDMAAPLIHSLRKFNYPLLEKYHYNHHRVYK